MQRGFFPLEQKINILLQQKINISLANTWTYAISNEIRLNKFCLMTHHLDRDPLYYVESSLTDGEKSPRTSP